MGGLLEERVRTSPMKCRAAEVFELVCIVAMAAMTALLPIYRRTPGRCRSRGRIALMHRRVQVTSGAMENCTHTTFEYSAGTILPAQRRRREGGVVREGGQVGIERGQALQAGIGRDDLVGLKTRIRVIWSGGDMAKLVLEVSD